MFRIHRRLGSLAAAFTLVVGSSIGLTQDANAYVTCGSAGGGHCYALYGNGYFTGGNTPINGAGVTLK